MTRFAIIFAALSGLAAVALGAFGAHALKASLSIEQLAVWNTAVFYQFIHTLAILLAAALGSVIYGAWQKRAITFFVLGILLFSGSLYALVLVGLGKLGMVTPIGGVCFMLGWLCVALGARR